jgi:hypothetical protein
MAGFTEGADILIRLGSDFLRDAAGAMAVVSLARRATIRAGDSRVHLHFDPPTLPVDAFDALPEEAPERNLRVQCQVRVRYHQDPIREQRESGDACAVVTVPLDVRFPRNYGGWVPELLPVETTAQTLEADSVNVLWRQGVDPAVVQEAIRDYFRRNGARSLRVRVPALPRVRLWDVRPVAVPLAGHRCIGIGVEGYFESEALAERQSIAATRADSVVDDRLVAPTARGWCATLDASFAKRAIYAALERKLGALPPPQGESSVNLGHDTRLRRLDVELVDNAIRLSGRFRVHVDLCLASIDLDFTFRARVGLSLRDGTLSARLLDGVKVEPDDPEAAVADFLSFGHLTSTIEDGLQAVCAQNSELWSFGPRVVPDFVSRNGLRTRVTLRQAQVRITPAGLLLTGGVRLDPPDLPTTGTLRVSRAGPSARRLDGFGLDVPGSAIERLHWNFGDGQQLSATWPEARLVVVHAYAGPQQERVGLHDTPEPIRVTLQANDEAPLVAAVTPGRMVVGRVVCRYRALPDSRCPDRFQSDQAVFAGGGFEIEVQVSDDCGPLDGAQVTVSGSGREAKALTATTNSAGRCTVSGSVADGEWFPDPASVRDRLLHWTIETIGYLELLVSKPGYVSISGAIPVDRCSRITPAPEFLEGWIGRTIGYLPASTRNEMLEDFFPDRARFRIYPWEPDPVPDFGQVARLRNGRVSYEMRGGALGEWERNGGGPPR